MGDKKENLLIVRFDDKLIDMLKEWKKMWIYEYGLGAIKRRTEELIREDLNRLKECRRLARK